jgi:uncharacterized membrane protein affecting hemolysin expression
MLNKTQLDVLIKDVYDMGERIKATDKLIASLENPKLREAYNKDLLEMIRSYNIMIGFLETQLEKYIKYERDTKQVPTFMYRRILKQLKKM